MPNPVSLAATVFVRGLVEAGVAHVVIAPGSRSTPLVLAMAEAPALRLWSLVDERGAAFFALGLAKATGTVVGLVCTSGTAAANMYPAVIEASQARVPLLVLSGDRPHELRGSGANQTIDQIRLFGNYAKWFVDAPVPQSPMPDRVMRHFHSMSHRAVAKALEAPWGVVHVNFPFRKPLEPAGDEGTGIGIEQRPLRVFTPMLTPQEAAIQAVAGLIAGSAQGLIVAGPDAGVDERVYALGERLGYPVLADPLSGVRYCGRSHEAACTAYDAFLRNPASVPPPEIILRFGGIPVSRRLDELIARHPPQMYVHVGSDGTWADDQHLVTHEIHGEAGLVLQGLLGAFPRDRGRTPFTDAWLGASASAIRQLEASLDRTVLTDASVVAEVLGHAPQDAQLFFGNSLTIRLADLYGADAARLPRLVTYGNRGTSGIDGNVSTAFGICAGAPEQRTVAILGDLTTLHDLGGLLAAARFDLPLILVVINNNGGGIFRELPVSRFAGAFEPFFLTPTGRSFAGAAQMFGLDYAQVSEQASLVEALHRALAGQKPALIEAMTSPEADQAQRERVRVALGQ
jgi:2-succinyl-5-enolpyruvyl-6-hydroxy-3-cyclohexene-1-carboxylate synthase